MEYFAGIDDMKELKKAYKQWAMKLHPDCGGSEEEFKEMGQQYEVCFKNIKLGIKNRTHSENINTEDVDDGYREVINALLNIEVNVELCGEWLWISGNTKEHKDTLKELGCHWASKKKQWYWKPAWMKKCYNRKEMSMEDIRNKYGSVNVRGTAHRTNELTA